MFFLFALELLLILQFRVDASYTWLVLWLDAMQATASIISVLVGLANGPGVVSTRLKAARTVAKVLFRGAMTRQITEAVGIGVYLCISS